MVKGVYVMVGGVDATRSQELREGAAAPKKEAAVRAMAVAGAAGQELREALEQRRPPVMELTAEAGRRLPALPRPAQRTPGRPAG
jgi:hypothetical protein